LIIPQNDNGKYKIDSRPSRTDPEKKVRIEVHIVLEDEDFRTRVFEKIKENATQDSNEAKFGIGGLDKNNVRVRPVYDFTFVTFDHDGVEYPLVVTETRNFLPNTQGHATVTLYVEVDKKNAEDILQNPEQIVIKCSYEQAIVQQDRSTNIVSIGDITKSGIYADLKQQATGKLIKRNDIRKLLSTLATNITVYSETDRPEGNLPAMEGLINRIVAIFEQRSQTMYESTQAFLNSKILSDKDFQADVLTGEVHKTEDTNKVNNEFNSKTAGSSGKGILHTFTSVLNPVNMVKNAVSGIIGNDTNSNSQDTSLKNTIENTTKRENSWTGEKISPKDVVLVTDLLNAMEQNISLSYNGVVNNRTTNCVEHIIAFKNFDYTPAKVAASAEAPPPPPPPALLTETAEDINVVLVRVEGGTFKMGGQDNEASDSEKPVHEVELDTFYMGKYPITQAQYRKLMGSNPSHFRGDDLPVEQVSWEDAKAFCAKLTEKSGRIYRLPTEAEWEYAARGGNKSRGYKYAGSNDLDEVAWYSGNSADSSRSVGKRKANELGIHDMSGNVWEWCQDWYDSAYYKNSPRKNPKGPASGSFRVLRGGSWGNSAVCCRVAIRDYGTPTSRNGYSGFRVVLVP